MQGERAPEKSSGGEVQSIEAAIAKLDPNDPKQFTASGKPQVDALEHVLGRQVSAAERDAAWDKVNADD
jgi:hypothetical protein